MTEVRVAYLLDRRSVRCDTRPQLRALLANGASNLRPLHFALVVHNDAGVIFKVKHESVLTADGLALPDNDSRHHLFPKCRFTLFDGSDKEIAGSRGWEAVEATADAGNS